MPFTLEGGGAANAAGGGGFDFGSLFSNPLVLQMMATMGASLDPQGPAGAIGGMTNQWIQTQNYMKMMKKLLAGGGVKMTIGDGKFSMTGDSKAFDSALKGEGEGSSSLADWTSTLFPSGQTQEQTKAGLRGA